MAAGKNTVFKQFCKGRKDHSDRDLAFYKNEAYVNLILTVAAIYDKMTKLSLHLSNEEHERFAMDMQALSVNVTSVNLKYSSEMHNKMIGIFSDTEFTRYLNEYFYEAHCPEGVRYFIDKIRSISPDHYTPTHEDIVHMRRKNTGITTTTIEYKNTTIALTLVAGQRSERKKWNAVLKTGSVMLFVASLSDYDQVCYEDESTNRQNDSLNLFESYISREQFLGETVYLLLNKVDVFKTKYANSDLSLCYPSFSRSQYPTAESAIQFITQQFEDRFTKHRNDRTNLIIFETNAASGDMENVLDTIYQKESADPFRQMTF